MIATNYYNTGQSHRNNAQNDGESEMNVIYTLSLFAFFRFAIHISLFLKEALWTGYYAKVVCNLPEVLL